MSEASVPVQQDQPILFVKVNVEQVFNKLSDSNIFKKAFRNLFEGMAPEVVPSVELAKNQDPEVYCELIKAPESTLDVAWRLRNPKGIAWPPGMELVPIMSAPEMKIFLDSKIQLVAAETDAILNLQIQVPSSYPA